MDQYYKLRRNLEHTPSRCLEAIVGHHALSVIDKRDTRKIEKEWADYICYAYDDEPCDAIRRVLRKMVMGHEPLDLGILSTRASQTCYQTKLQLDDYRRMLTELKLTESGTDNFYICATVCMAMAQKLGFWLDVILYE